MIIILVKISKVYVTTSQDGIKEKIKRKTQKYGGQGMKKVNLTRAVPISLKKIMTHISSNKILQTNKQNYRHKHSNPDYYFDITKCTYQL